MIRDALREALAHPLEGTDFPELGVKYGGKVRDNYTTADGRRYLVVTDRISAFDRVLGTLPLKGQILNAAATLAPDEVPTSRPNSRCRRFVIAMASLLVIFTSPSSGACLSNCGMKPSAIPSI